MIRLCIVMLFLCMTVDARSIVVPIYPTYGDYYANGERIAKSIPMIENTYKVVLKNGEEFQGYCVSNERSYGSTTIFSAEIKMVLEHDVIEKIVLISSPIYLKNGKVLKVDIIEEKADFLLVKENKKLRKIAKNDIKFYNKGGGKYIDAIKDSGVERMPCSLIPKIKDCYDSMWTCFYATKKNEKLSNLELLPGKIHVTLLVSKDKYFDLTSLNKYKNIRSLQITINDSNDYAKQISSLKYIKSLDIKLVNNAKLGLKIPKLESSIIEYIYIYADTIIGDVDLRGFPKLKLLYLRRTKIKSLPLLPKNIKEINVKYSKIEDFSSLKSVKCKVVCTYTEEDYIENLKKTYPNIEFEMVYSHNPESRCD